MVRRRFPTESPLPFDNDLEPIPETLTALRGVTLVVQMLCSPGLPAMAREQVRTRERERGYGKIRG